MSVIPTPGNWRAECVSDHCRVVVGEGRRKITLARLAPKRIPEAETASNGRVMAAGKKLLRVAMAYINGELGLSHEDRTLLAVEAIAEAQGRPRYNGEWPNDRTVTCDWCGWRFTVHGIPRTEEYRDCDWFCPHCSKSSGEKEALAQLRAEVAQ